MEVAVKGRAKRKHLNVDDLEKSKAGLEALINPQNINRSWRNSHNLKPRTTMKRRKCGNYITFTPFLHNLECCDPGTSLLTPTCTNGLHGERAAEDEVSSDDEDLLPAGLEEPENKDIDYFEGITAEMFEEDFDGSHETVHEEPEVEALPDATYGLLGSSEELLVPCGHIDDLPEEVLRRVLGLLPARDMYRSAGLVCHRWRGIIEDAKFMPFKKRYYRFLMNEGATSNEVYSAALQGGITNPEESEHSVRNLVIAMANHKFGERVNPTEVLERLKKHRFFPHAEASIRLYIRNVPRCHNLEIEGPNPFAAMAVILLLSERIDDVLALVTLLSGCMLYGAVTEYLNHVATLLLAARRRNVKISERLHYNIYYVLHLRDNGPFSVSSSENRGSHMKMTSEQHRVLSHDIEKDHVVKIVAFAGTGKTATLVKYAEQRPHLRFLYVAFNKSVASEASQRFPVNVDCKTIHSLAYRDIGKMYQKKLSFNLHPFSINTVLPKGRGGYANAKVVVTTLKNFMASIDPTIAASHVPSEQMYVEDAKNIWMKMKDVNETTVQGYHMPHDGYLKLWQLRNPKVCLSDRYDVIFIDEAQDCTPTIMDVLLTQKCGKVLVGDPYQQIYSFRGAINALESVQHTHIYYLTQSFRFGAEIAYVGATILRVCKQVEKILVGGRQQGERSRYRRKSKSKTTGPSSRFHPLVNFSHISQGSVFDEKSAQAQQDVANGRSPAKGNTAILSRCNFGVFSEAVRLTEANPECTIHFIGGLDNIGLNTIKDIWYLMEDNHNRKLIKDRLIATFVKIEQNPLEALKNYAQKTEDRNLEAKICIVTKYKNRIPALVKCLNKQAEGNAKKADFILGTVHKAKGLEFDIVIVSDDFVTVPFSRHAMYRSKFSMSEVPETEWNLLYTAVTRAKTTLIITKTIHRILTLSGEYLLKSVMPVRPLKAGETPACVINACTNCIAPGVPFMMCKRQIPYSTGTSREGALCDRCVWIRAGPIARLMTDRVLSPAESDQHVAP
ncbi:F-box DNA helicase 1 isoform X2 [Syngnathoides biaculeatus]|uniref:F-box DNA helicase 1 isoform X2 n=1 Tax=Syngnathoides biaculeatus TaxID=300417 RepID=UPI002ADDF54B|nr:F-box DNA helicase 1 isoform X2 [Syngnathoides biaculeatus]